MKQQGKLLNLGKREKIQQANSTILIVVAVASVVISMALVAGNFLWKQKGYNDRVYKEKKIARDTLRTNVTNAQQLATKYQQIEDSKSIANAKTILDGLPGTYDSPALRTSLEALAQRSSITITSLQAVDQEGQVQETSITPSPVEMPFSISVAGDYAKVTSFLKDFERTIRPINVKSVVISGTDGEMKADISAVTYFQPSKEIGITMKEVQ